FALDCCDREALGHVATTAGVKGEDIRDLMVSAVEYRFGPVNRRSRPSRWWKLWGGRCASSQAAIFGGAAASSARPAIVSRLM
ncbi:hypothetical protein K9U33_20760, partial [Rhodoblastus acidophilus]|nr:hypothetical protein [Candidatus Rhodoblastus alkanivorans]